MQEVTDSAVQERTIVGPCGICDHDPACGQACAHTSSGTTWLCHDDTHSCFERALRQSAAR